MITGAELLEALPIIVSLIVIEGLLSVDNALAIAAMASHLPGKQKVLALRLGIIGAYAFRGIVLMIASWIAANRWVTLFGAGYLIWLMCSHLTKPEEEDHDEAKRRKKPGLLMTVVQIELMDLTLSIDNVVAAVAMAPKDPATGQPTKMWIVYAGVFIGILALRLLAGYCIRLLERFPILAKTAFLLVGYVGFILLAELIFHIHVHSGQKFVGIVIITGLTILYSRQAWAQRLFTPVVNAGLSLMHGFACLLDGVFWPLRKLHEVIARRFLRYRNSEKDQPAG